MLTQIQQDTSSSSKLCQQLANIKCDKKDLNELRNKLSNQVQEKVDHSEFTSSISNFTADMTQKLLDLRTEIFKRITDQNNECMNAIAKKANHEDFKILMEEKVDMQVLKTYLNQKLGLAEFDALRQVVERVQTDLQSKANQFETQ